MCIRDRAISVKAPKAPDSKRLDQSIVSITQAPQMNAAAHFVRKKQPKYWPTVNFQVLRIRLGTLWMVRDSGPKPYSPPQ